MHHLDIGHMVVSALIHGMIYSTIWKVMRSVTIPEAIGLTSVVIGALWLAHRFIVTRQRAR